ncbi:hypothetical protein FRX31_005068 [Thalictrum thalictroides]|uniref:Uncharacterized protein n=1 Tax=Thalictrum thalictroides TaxID=46969 RepID=A0A7J6X7H2_THATH|nr:hypothetical protein FRX31_005068 [Thalictrum thalictroides]
MISCPEYPPKACINAAGLSDDEIGMLHCCSFKDILVKISEDEDQCKSTHPCNIIYHVYTINTDRLNLI